MFSLRQILAPVAAFVLCLGPLVAPTPAQAEDRSTPLPAHRYMPQQDTDFFGADLTPLFDTTEAACVRACSAQEACVAYTFNARSSACFPKSAVSERQPYVGARSARKLVTEAAAQAGAAQRWAALPAMTAADVQFARDFVQQMLDAHGTTTVPAADLLIALDTAEDTGDLSNALRWAAQAVALTDRADLWTRFARLALARAGDESLSRSAQRRLQRDGLAAAINGYLRAPTPESAARALDVLASALERSRRGRDSLSALRLAQEIDPQPHLAERLDAAVARYGFRVTGHRVDNDAAAPRICAEFSEPLARGGVDYETFVRSDISGLVVTAEGQQLCLDGVSHGSRYRVTLRRGLPAAQGGEVLHKDVTLQLYVQDRAPIVRFPGRAYVLPRLGDAAVPVETVNTDRVELTLMRVSDRNLVRSIREDFFARPLNAYDADRFAADLAQPVWQGSAQVGNTLNQETLTRLPMAEALAGNPVGVYVLTATVPGQDPHDKPAASQWFVLSDLGLASWSGTDGLHVAVRGLGRAEARSGVAVSLISRANAVLGEAVTDAEGFAHFPAPLTRGTGAAAPALLVAKSGGSALDEGGDAPEDIAFLSLTDPAFDLSDRGVEGNPPAPPIDTFLTTDRGAYRVGEVIHATVLTRDVQGRALTGLPITAVLRRPDGEEYSRHVSEPAVQGARDGAQAGSAVAQQGGHVFALPLDGQVPRGAWRLDVLSDPKAAPLASQTVLVEDFLPERIDVALSLPETPLRLSTAAKSPPRLSVQADYLFGAPGAGLEIEGSVQLRATRSLPDWEGYLFGAADAAFRPRTNSIGPAQTGPDGQAEVPLDLPELTDTPRTPLETIVALRVREGSGRPVERRLRRTLAPEQPVIGIRKGFEGALPEGGEAAFEVIQLTAEGTRAAATVAWELNRVETRYHWYQLYGNWAWEPTTRRIRVATGTAEVPAEAPARLALPTERGAYELVLRSGSGAQYAETAVRFDSGWYGSDSGKGDTPDRQKLSLDAAAYDVGDTAQLQLEAARGGVALVTVLSNRVIARQVVPVSAGQTRVALPVTADWGTGAYVTALVLHGGAGTDAQAAARDLAPARQLGLVHAAVRPGDRQLQVEIDAPEQSDGQSGVLRAAIEVAGLRAGEEAFVTLAAVDVGILNLTRFAPPDVTGHYFGQRRLGVGLRDLYGRLIDNASGAMGQVRSGGDAAAAAQLQAPPPTEELMAWFSGPVAVDAQGRAVVEIDKPAFNGTIRLMAVAWSPSGVGDATRDVVARDPVVVTASLPRFLQPGDDSRLLLEFVHAAGAGGEMALEVTAEPGLRLGEVPGTVTVAEGGRARVEVPLRAVAPGDPRLSVVLSLPGGKAVRRVLTMPVRQLDPVTSVTQQVALAPGAVFTFDDAVLAGFRPDTATAVLSAGPLARFDVPGLLRVLDGYPYGCTEQITSGAMPLLYVGAVAEAAGLGQPKALDAKIGGAVAAVLARQASNGGFGMWRAEAGDLWLDAYVTDFLWRAQAEGHAVPARAMDRAMDNLRNRLAYAPDFDRGGEDLAYALLVLARAGKAALGDLRYYADTRAEALGTALAQAQLGAALAAYGDSRRADALFVRAQARLEAARAGRAPAPSEGWRRDFGTDLRDLAAVLRLGAEAGSDVLRQGELSAWVQEATGPLSTQEAAQVVLTAHALGQSAAAEAPLRIDGAPARGPVVRRLAGVGDQPVTVENLSDRPVPVTVTARGVAEVPPEAGGYGYAITRRYYTAEGEEISGPVPVGQRLVAVLEITPFERRGARLVVDDPLPAGLEIDNPNLISAGALTTLEWLETAEVEHAEYRADRFVAAVNDDGAETFSLAYRVRAVTPGHYHHAAATVADMYRPAYQATTATGGLRVLP